MDSAKYGKFTQLVIPTKVGIHSLQPVFYCVFTLYRFPIEVGNDICERLERHENAILHNSYKNKFKKRSRK